MKIVSAKQSGQAVIEYILVLFVVVSILLGVMTQFSKEFRKFTDAYFGDYLACLLEVGELPGLGSGGGQCKYDSKFGPYNNPADHPNAGGSGQDKGKDDGSQKSEGKHGSYASGGSGGGGGSSATETNSRFGKGFGTYNRDGRPISVVVGTAKSDVYTGSTEASSGGAKANLNNKVVTTTQYVDQSGGIIDPFEERKVKEVTVATAKDTHQDNLKAKKAKVEVNRKPAASDTKDDNQKLGFGDFLRWLLIAAIIIAVIVFLGGQALQISKSWE